MRNNTDKNWEVLLYTSSTGRPALHEFLLSLDAATYAKTLRQIDLLEENGVNLGLPHTRTLGDGLVELRVRGKQEVRIFDIFERKMRIVLLHGFVKKTQTTPRKELLVAKKRQYEVIEHFRNLT